MRNTDFWNQLRSKEVLDQVKLKEIPFNWFFVEDLLERDYQKKESLSRSGKKIYGVNTLVGHEDKHSLDVTQIESFQEELLWNHRLGSTPYYSEFEARCIGYVKAHSITLGGTAVSNELFNYIKKAVIDQDFDPQIPMHASYSCGDVIPAAHWATDLLEYIRGKYDSEFSLKSKEGLSLINGNFIKLGIAISKIEKILATQKAFVSNSKNILEIGKIDTSNLTKLYAINNADSIIEAVEELGMFQGIEQTTQPPVSIRSLPQMVSAFKDTTNDYLQSIDLFLERRSDNPLIFDDAISQASFLSPQLTLTTGKLIEMLLSTMWIIESRIQYLLSGEIPHIPMNAKKSKTDLGLIQIPKLSKALLEEARSCLGTRTFVSGSSTSYGIEDFWDYGLRELNKLDWALNYTIHLMAIEKYVLDYCSNAIQNSFAEEVERIENLIKSEGCL